MFVETKTSSRHAWVYVYMCSTSCFFPLCVFLCDRERREITGDKPPDLSGFCGSHVNGTLYIFAGCDPAGYTNQVSLRGRPLVVFVKAAGFSSEPLLSWRRFQNLQSLSSRPCSACCTINKVFNAFPQMMEKQVVAQFVHEPTWKGCLSLWCCFHTKCLQLLRNEFKMLSCSRQNIL